MPEERQNQISQQMALRLELCNRLGFGSLERLHETIVKNPRHDANELQARGLHAPVLQLLGYTLEGMKKLGFKDATLARLGYGAEQPAVSTPVSLVVPARPARKHDTQRRYRTRAGRFGVIAYQQVRELVNSGCKANGLKLRGYNVLHCKNAGFSVNELLEIGFTIGELVNVFEIDDLLTAGCMTEDLRDYLSDEQLIAATR